ncbi:MAG: hypothetical protein PUP91_13755 [Rhizonema sp. PD37]|nr:hypothetical protein [Rhizonema sp. PD37]
MRYQVKPPPKPRFKSFMLVDGKIFELKSLTYRVSGTTGSKMRTESTKTLPITQYTVEHCCNLLREALQQENIRQKKLMDSEKE